MKDNKLSEINPILKQLHIHNNSIFVLLSNNSSHLSILADWFKGVRATDKDGAIERMGIAIAGPHHSRSVGEKKNMLEVLTVTLEEGREGGGEGEGGEGGREGGKEGRGSEEGSKHFKSVWM